MQRLIIAAVSLSLSLGGLSGGVLAQTNSGVVVIDDASGSNGTNRISGNCEISGSGRDRLVTCTDLRPGRGTALTDPGTETAPAAGGGHRVAPAPEAASAPETTDTAVATETDQDADNYADALEPGRGSIRPTPTPMPIMWPMGTSSTSTGPIRLNADTDGDGVTGWRGAVRHPHRSARLGRHGPGGGGNGGRVRTDASAGVLKPVPGNRFPLLAALYPRGPGASVARGLRVQVARRLEDEHHRGGM